MTDNLPELKFQFINGEGALALKEVKEVHFDQDSKAAIDLGLEECQQIPEHIRNSNERALFVEVQSKLRKWQEAIKKTGTEEKDEIKELTDKITECIREELKPFNDLLVHVIEQITRWDSTVRVGLSAHTAGLRRKGLESQKKAESAKSKTEQKKHEKQASLYFKAADKEEKEDKAKKSEGAVHKERWGSETIIDPVALVRNADTRFYRIVIEQNEVASYCKDIERNGGTIHPTKTIPGLKLVKKPFTSFY